MSFVVDKRKLGKSREKYWIIYIKRRIKNNKNFIGFISGPTGSGKSYSSLQICEQLDPQFDISHCVFGGLELMELLNSGKIKRGSAILFEEVGVELSNKNWASVTNKMLNYLLQTCRHRNFILIMNSPYMDFVDASTRKLFHAEMETMGIDFDKREVKLKPQLIQYNSKLKKFYFKRLKVITSIGRIPVSVWRVPKPSPKLVVDYEKKKLEYTHKLNQKIYNELKMFEEKGKKQKSLTEIQQEILELIKQGLTVDQIAEKRNRHPRAIKESLRLIRRKGYVFKPVFDPIMHRKVVKYVVYEPNEGEMKTITSNKPPV